MGAGTQAAGPPSIAFSGALQGAGPEMEQLEVELASIRDAGAADSGFT